jgi:ATPase involved in DNA replication initiation
MITEIKKIVENQLQIKLDVDNKKADVNYARKIYYMICRTKTQMAYSKIGRLINKDTATVRYHCKNFEYDYMYDKEFKEKYNRCLENFLAKKTKT